MSITAPTGIERIETMQRVAPARPEPISVPGRQRFATATDSQRTATPPRSGVPGHHIAVWVIAGTLGWAGIIAGANWLL